MTTEIKPCPNGCDARKPIPGGQTSMRIICDTCGLSAPLKVWNRLSDMAAVVQSIAQGLDEAMPNEHADMAVAFRDMARAALGKQE